MSPVGNALRATVILLKHDTQTQIVCTAEFVSETRVVTAAHCLKSASGRELADAAGARVAWLPYEAWAADNYLNTRHGRIVRFDERADIALIESEISGDAYVTVRSDDAAVGDRVFDVGHPDGALFTVRDGYLIDPEETDTDNDGSTFTLMRASIPVWFGSSGGGLYDVQGRLIGVTSRLGDEGRTGYFVPTETIRRFLRPR